MRKHHGTEDIGASFLKAPYRQFATRNRIRQETSRGGRRLLLGMRHFSLLFRFFAGLRKARKGVFPMMLALHESLLISLAL